MNVGAPPQPAQVSGEAFTGIGIVESAIDLRNGITNGSWLEGGLGLAGTALEALSLAVDPLGTLAEYAFSWVIEHCGPLRRWLDWLAGDVARITAYAGTWHAVAKTVAGAKADFTTEVERGSAAWRGTAGETYRASMAKHARFFSASEVCASTIGAVVEVVGMLVGVVRETVRDLIARAVATLVVRVPMWAAAASVPVGAAVLPVVTQVRTLVARTSRDISAVIVKLTRSLDKLRPLMGRLTGLWEDIGNGLRGLRGTDAGGGITRPDAVKQSGTTTTSGASGGGGGGNTVTSGAGGGNQAGDQPSAGGGGQGDQPPPGGTNPPPPGSGGAPRPPSRRPDLDRPHRQLTKAEFDGLQQHLDELARKHPERYQATIRDPDHKGPAAVGTGPQEEAKIALDLWERGQFTDDYARPTEKGNGDFLDNNKKWDLKRPRDPFVDNEFTSMLGAQIVQRKREVVIDTRFSSQADIDRMARIVQGDDRWRDHVIWYP
ncbi:MAG: hypothetical protein HOV94_04835 [Saccharothrix sp.]|nr:hypothetical protein [Saccharothrix sp.]